MTLADTVATCRSGVFQLGFFDAQNHKLGGGSAFLSNGYLITNHHVFIGYQQPGVTRAGFRRDDMPAGQFITLSSQDFGHRLVTDSQEQSYDYAVLNYPEVIRPTDRPFKLEAPAGRRIGESIALLGFPLEHDNLTCHQGIISSFYQSGLAGVIQIDASVNAGNSGGPLIDPVTGVAIGIVTRKATGLTALFNELRQTIHQNIQVAQASQGGIAIGGLDPVQAFIASQNQMLVTMNEIERQANVGIGYAFSAEHVLGEPCVQV